MSKRTKPDSRFVDFRAVKAAVTMEQVLQHYGILERYTRRQDSLTGPCPIHNGTNPTQFRVSLSKNCWNCFSQCHCGGNVLDFVAKKEGVEPVEAANLLIEWFHLDRKQLNALAPAEPLPGRVAESSDSSAAPALAALPCPAAPTRAPAATEETGVNKPLKFQLELDAAHPYLTERGLSPEAVQEFGLGYCAKGVMAQRIAIPIHNAKGELVGYVGRWPGDNPPDGRPKYRLPDGFKKAVEIYRFAQAMREPREHPLVVVEGFFDAMRLWQLGAKKVVALMGSSLSLAQEKMLAESLGPTAQVIVVFDEDDAGRIGRESVLQRLAVRAFVRVVAFPTPGAQPKRLTVEEAKQFGLLPP